MAVVKAQRVPQKEISANDTISLFCYLFPQYKYHEAKKVPFIRVESMIKAARKEIARRNLDLLQISVAPHSKVGAKKLTKEFQEIVNG